MPTINRFILGLRLVQNFVQDGPQLIRKKIGYGRNLPTSHTIQRFRPQNQESVVNIMFNRASLQIITSYLCLIGSHKQNIIHIVFHYVQLSPSGDHRDQHHSSSNRILQEVIRTSESYSMF